MKVRKGYPIYDKFGRNLTKGNETKFEDAVKKAKGLAGFGAAAEGTSILRLVAIALVAAAAWKMISKPS